MYPIYVHKDKDGSASGFAPGVTGLFFAGETIKKCIEDAKSAFATHFNCLFEEGRLIPKAAEVEEYLDDENCQNGLWCLVEIDTLKYESKIRKTHNQQLQYIDVAVEYLREALDSGDPRVILMALENIAKAHSSSAVAEMLEDIELAEIVKARIHQNEIEVSLENL
ncbi:type II toxin-antitoxin system HicB family antitoxin [Zooshikella ganghwensis]|uniref:type II toxin-antitoxin system HicB family antitoxin n=1 Tax=Zooshikella ganghwensis TaxID=202772 RepID=UPI0003F547B0|nr:type II toxin-antitoxin system HicB family antitoxin [Zooshikella ganghwensis]